MKTLKLACILLLLTGYVVNAQKTNITLGELPKSAQVFIGTNFKEQTVSYIIKDKDIVGVDYEVILSKGTKIEFDSKGNWKEIDGNDRAISNSVLPKTIASYISKNYKNQQVEKIEKDTDFYKKGYKVALLNDLELKFDKNGKFLRIDD